MLIVAPHADIECDFNISRAIQIVNPLEDKFLAPAVKATAGAKSESGLFYFLICLSYVFILR